MSDIFFEELWQATLETLIMIGLGVPLSLVFGGLIGICLYFWRPDGLAPRPALHLSVGALVNVVRSFPFLVLLIATVPLSRLVVGTSIGPTAAAIPLAIAAIAYFARLVELALNDVSAGVIEAALAMGASKRQIVFRVLLREARSSLILAVTTLLVSYISYSAAAGVVGGGGLGDLAIRHGYYRFQPEVMIATVLVLVIFVQSVQFFGSFLSRKFDHS